MKPLKINEISPFKIATNGNESLGNLSDKIKTLRENSSRLNPSNFQSYIKNVS